MPKSAESKIGPSVEPIVRVAAQLLERVGIVLDGPGRIKQADQSQDSAVQAEIPDIVKPAPLASSLRSRRPQA